jgi:hypothetical protein
LFLPSYFLLASSLLLFFSCSPASLSPYLAIYFCLNCTFWSSFLLSHAYFSSSLSFSFTILGFLLYRFLSIPFILVPFLVLGSLTSS